jgi:hypothetical protein
LYYYQIAIFDYRVVFPAMIVRLASEPQNELGQHGNARSRKEDQEACSEQRTDHLQDQDFFGI